MEAAKVYVKTHGEPFVTFSAFISFFLKQITPAITKCHKYELNHSSLALLYVFFSFFCSKAINEVVIIIVVCETGIPRYGIDIHCVNRIEALLEVILLLSRTKVSGSVGIFFALSAWGICCENWRVFRGKTVGHASIFSKSFPLIFYLSYQTGGVECN